MDNIRTLMDKKEYELVIKLTSDSKDVTNLFYRITSFVGLNKPNEALKCIEDNQKLLENEMDILIKMNIEILCVLGKFDEAYEKLEYYENLPYVSQQVEDILRIMPDYIRKEEKNAYKSYSFKEEDIQKMLHSKLPNDILLALDSLREKDITPYILSLQNIMVNFPNQSIRSLTLFLLIEKDYTKEVKFNSHGEIVTLIPFKCEKPFSDEKFNSIVKRIRMEYKDPVLAENAIQFLSSYVINYFPNKIIEKDEVILSGLYVLVSEYMCLKDGMSKSQLCERYGIECKDIDEFLNKLKSSIETI